MIWLGIVVSVALLFWIFGTTRKVSAKKASEARWAKMMKASRRQFRGQVKPGTEAYRRLQSRDDLSKRSRQNNFRMAKGHRKM